MALRVTRPTGCSRRSSSRPLTCARIAFTSKSIASSTTFPQSLRTHRRTAQRAVGRPHGDPMRVPGDKPAADLRRRRRAFHSRHGTERVDAALLPPHAADSAGTPSAPSHDRGDRPRRTAMLSRPGIAALPPCARSSAMPSAPSAAGMRVELDRRPAVPRTALSRKPRSSATWRRAPTGRFTRPADEPFDQRA